MTPTDPELIARTVCVDDRRAFGELVHRHQSIVRRFLRHLTRGDDALADDLAQETFIQAYRGLARYRADSSFTTWLLGIAHNRFRNANRRTRRLSWVPEDRAVEQAAPSSERTTDLRQDLLGALRQLSPDEQIALELCYQQGLSHGEIAQALEWPLGTVKTHISRSKEKLRRLLSAWNPKT